MQIRKASEVTKPKSYGEDFIENDLFMKDEIYNNLKVITNNEALTLDNPPTGSYSEFIADMEALHQEIINQEPDQEYPGILVAIDEYLGELGITEEYPVKKDITHLAKFINADFKFNR